MWNALFAILLGLTIAVPARAGGYGVYGLNEFKQRWMGYHDDLTPDHLNRIFSYLERDARASQLLAQLRKMTGRQSAADLMAVIGICADDKSDFDLQMHGPSTFGLTGVSEGDGPRTMCLSRGLNLGDAIATFVHELTHFVIAHNACSADKKRYKNAETFSVATIQDPGEEVDAFLTEYAARIHIEGSRMGINYQHREFFTDSGQFLGTREEFARLLLSIPDYKDSFGQRFERCRKLLGY